MAELGEPPGGLEKPLFVYGALQPGELAHGQISAEVTRKIRARLERWDIQIRDGLPILFKPGRVADGWLLGLTRAGYATVQRFEPAHLYRWESVQVRVGDATEEANVLIGRSPDKGGAEGHEGQWSSADDPVLRFGPVTAAAMVADLQPRLDILVRPSPGEDRSYWEPFFRLMAAYLLLWTVYERLTALMFGPGLDVMTRLTRLEGEDVFRRAFKVSNALSGLVVYDSRDLGKATVRPDGTRALSYWYQVRSNLSHRGKSAYRDSTIVYDAFVDAYNVLRLMMIELIPGLKLEWRANLGEDFVFSHRGENRDGWMGSDRIL
jgi:Gamma-glutamyl cyclotransferase, AIG2-like